MKVSTFFKRTVHSYRMCVFTFASKSLLDEVRRGLEEFVHGEPFYVQCLQPQELNVCVREILLVRIDLIRLCSLGTVDNMGDILPF